MSGPHGINIHSLQSRRFLEQVEGYQVLLTGRTCFCGCHSASILSISSRAEMRIINTIAITRLGRLNSRARRNSVIARSARKSIVLNIFTLNFFTLNFEI